MPGTTSPSYPKEEEELTEDLSMVVLGKHACPPTHEVETVGEEAYKHLTNGGSPRDRSSRNEG